MPKLIKDSVYSEMYRVEWPDGEISDMVNKTRANEAIRVYLKNNPTTHSRRALRCPGKLTGAFK